MGFSVCFLAQQASSKKEPTLKSKNLLGSKFFPFIVDSILIELTEIVSMPFYIAQNKSNLRTWNTCFFLLDEVTVTSTSVISITPCPIAITLKAFRIWP